MASKRKVVIPANLMLVGEYCVAEAAQHYPVKKVEKATVPPKEERRSGNIQYSGLHQQSKKKEDLISFICHRYGDKNPKRAKGKVGRYKNHKATQPTIY